MVPSTTIKMSMIAGISIVFDVKPFAFSEVPYKSKVILLFSLSDLFHYSPVTATFSGLQNH